MLNENLVRSKMQAVLDLVSADIASVRAGRVSPSLVSDLLVTVYGGQQRLKIQELATISVLDAQTLEIEPWDKSIIGEIRQGILASGLNLNPIISGEKIRIVVPPMTSEDREKYLKLVSTKLEAGRVMIRQIRGDFMKEIQRSFENKEMGEDDKFDQEKKLQEITDEFVRLINELGEKKKEELMQV